MTDKANAEQVQKSHDKNIKEMYDRLGRKIFDFWLFLARVGLNEDIIDDEIMPFGIEYSTEDVSNWIANCLYLKRTQLVSPEDLSDEEENLITELEYLADEYFPSTYKDIFYIYMKYKNLFEYEDKDDDLSY